MTNPHADLVARLRAAIQTEICSYMGPIPDKHADAYEAGFDAATEHAIGAVRAVLHDDALATFIESRLAGEGATITDAMIESGARAVCKARDLNPNTLFQSMPGDGTDDFPEDGHFFNSLGDRCKTFFAWRKYASVTKTVLTAALPAQSRLPSSPSGGGREVLIEMAEKMLALGAEAHKLPKLLVYNGYTQYITYEHAAHLLRERAEAAALTAAPACGREERIATLFDAIKHGDDEHKRWLREAIDAHFAGKPVPPPTGKGTR